MDQAIATATLTSASTPTARKSGRKSVPGTRGPAECSGNLRMWVIGQRPTVSDMRGHNGTPSRKTVANGTRHNAKNVAHIRKAMRVAGLHRETAGTAMSLITATTASLQQAKEAAARVSNKQLRESSQTASKRDSNRLHADSPISQLRKASRAASHPVNGYI